MANGEEVFLLEEVQDYLQTYVSNNTKLVSPKFRITKGTNEGDNYMGTMYRVMIEGIENGVAKKLELFLKATRNNENVWGENLKDKSSRLFQREIQFYQEIVPIFQETVKKHKSVVRCPVLYSANVEADRELMIFGDLGAEGFVMKKSKILDYSHISLALRCLGEFHACSFLTRASNPTGFKKLKLKEHVYEKGDTWLLNKQIRSYFATSADIIKKVLADEGERYVERYQHFVDNIDEAMFGVIDAGQTEPYAVVIHGDFWTNNILFKYDKDGVPCDVRFVDFQMIRYATPAIDLVHILFSCCAPEVRNKYYEQLIREYHDALSKCLKNFDYDSNDLFPYDVLSQHIKKVGKYSAWLSTLLIPILFNDGEDKSVQNVFSQETLEEKLKSNSIFRNYIKASFKDLVDKNYL